MNRKIIGGTVGTPTKPKSIVEKSGIEAQVEQNKKDIGQLRETIADLSFELMITEVVNGIGKLAFVKKEETPTEGVTQSGNILTIIDGVTAIQNGSVLAIL